MSDVYTLNESVEESKVMNEGRACPSVKVAVYVIGYWQAGLWTKKGVLNVASGSVISYLPSLILLVVKVFTMQLITN